MSSYTHFTLEVCAPGQQLQQHPAGEDDPGVAGGIRQRTRVGDWEGDTVYGGIGKGLLVTLVDRNSRYVRIGLLRQRTAEGTRQVNENTNDLIRFFFPKGYDFRTVTEDDIARVEQLLNSRLRKCLGWRSPAEVFGVALAPTLTEGETTYITDKRSGFWRALIRQYNISFGEWHGFGHAISSCISS